MTLRLFYINIHYATFGIIAFDNIITGVPPIAAWMKGKSLQEVKPWLISKNAKIFEIKQ